MTEHDFLNVKGGFWEKLQFIILDSIRFFLRRLGPFGGFIICVFLFLDKWALPNTKDALIQKYILNVDKLPQYLPRDIARTIIDLLLIIATVLIVIIFRLREKKLLLEMQRIGEEKTRLQEGGLGPLEHSN
jgi:hypothetical protein